MTHRSEGWTWRKSSRSTADDKCVELACDQGGRLVAIGDTKNPNGPILALTSETIGRFVQMVKTQNVG